MDSMVYFYGWGVIRNSKEKLDTARSPAIEAVRHPTTCPEAVCCSFIQQMLIEYLLWARHCPEVRETQKTWLVEPTCIYGGQGKAKNTIHFS